MSLESFYTPQELADALKVTRRTVYTWLKEGRLRANKAGPKGWRITQAQLDAFLNPTATEPQQAKDARPENRPKKPGRRQ